jgi:hypothetical protein
MIDQHSWLIPVSGTVPFVFQEGRVGILDFKLHEIIETAWGNFDKGKIESFVEAFPDYKP